MPDKLHYNNTKSHHQELDLPESHKTQKFLLLLQEDTQGIGDGKSLLHLPVKQMKITIPNCHIS
jgi:hypothetical protein